MKSKPCNVQIYVCLDGNMITKRSDEGYSITKRGDKGYSI